MSFQNSVKSEARPTFYGQGVVKGSTPAVIASLRQIKHYSNEVTSQLIFDKGAKNTRFKKNSLCQASVGSVAVH